MPLHTSFSSTFSVLHLSTLLYSSTFIFITFFLSKQSTVTSFSSLLLANLPNCYPVCCWLYPYPPAPSTPFKRTTTSHTRSFTLARTASFTSFLSKFLFSLKLDTFSPPHISPCLCFMTRPLDFHCLIFFLVHLPFSVISACMTVFFIIPLFTDFPHGATSRFPLPYTFLIVRLPFSVISVCMTVFFIILYYSLTSLLLPPCSCRLQATQFFTPLRGTYLNGIHHSSTCISSIFTSTLHSSLIFASFLLNSCAYSGHFFFGLSLGSENDD